MEPTQCFETSAFNTQTPGKYPEDNSSNVRRVHKELSGGWEVAAGKGRGGMICVYSAAVNISCKLQWQ
jgi:hypothetical protein